MVYKNKILVMLTTNLIFLKTNINADNSKINDC